MKWCWDRAYRETDRKKADHEPQSALLYFLLVLVSMNNNNITRGRLLSRVVAGLLNPEGEHMQLSE